MLSYVIVIAASVQFALLISSLVVLARTPAQRIRYFSKTVWAIIAIFVNIIGPILFLTMGVSRTKTVDSRQSSERSPKDIVSGIYSQGSPDGEQ